MPNQRSIATTLQEISKALTAYAKTDGEPGLLTGYAGTALFFAYYHRLTGKRKYLDQVYVIIEKMAVALQEKELLHSYCSGIAGITWCVQHLTKEGFVDQDGAEDIFEDIDSFLFDAMMHDLGQGHYDFMHLALGITLYFLDKHPHEKTQHYLEQAVLQLKKKSIILESGLSWPDKISEEMESRSSVYNLGLAHGVPSIVAILGMIYEKMNSRVTVRPMIESALGWILSAKNEPGAVSLYPRKVNAVNEAIGNKASRLGWCYGDLGIGMTLLNSGIRLQVDAYKQQAIRILEHSLIHRNKENGSVSDASLCHGSMGVSHIYRRAYIATGEPIFLEGADLWLEETLRMASWKDGVAGFKYRSEKGPRNAYSLLEGVAGIGLGLIAAIDKDTDPSWDRCLLLS